MTQISVRKGDHLASELNPAIGIISDQVLQHSSTLRESLPSEVFAVDMEKVEGINENVCRPRPDGGP